MRKEGVPGLVSRSGEQRRGCPHPPNLIPPTLHRSRRFRPQPRPPARPRARRLPTDDDAYEARKEREKELEEDRKGAAAALTHNEFMYI